MTENTKKEPPYAFYFFLLSVVIIALSVWVIWFESVKLRPWKSYQAQYQELRHQKIKKEYEKVLQARHSPQILQIYKELNTKLKNAIENNKQPQISEQLSRITKERKRIREALKKNQTEFQEARGKFLELEYNIFKYQREEDQYKIKEFEREIERIEDQRKKLIVQEDVLKKKLSEFTIEIDKSTAEIRKLDEGVENARKKLKTLENIPVEIKQVYLEDLNQADRCQSCHVGIDEPDQVSDQNPFAQHPGYYIYLENHPINDFGCTFCHRGQGRATSSPDKAHGWIEHWQEPMFKGKMIQASCETCHGDVQHIQGGELIRKGSELIEKYGCYGCHKIAGYEDLRKVGPELTELGTKVNYTWLVNWLLDSKSYFDTARMPDFLLNQEQAEAIADYLFSMTRETRIDYSPGEINWDLADKGKAIWRQSRCSICHAMKGVGGAFEKIYAPDLGKIGSKMNRKWLYRWIEDPQAYFPQTKMPRFRFREEQIWALAEYLIGEYVDWDFDPQYTEPVPIKVESINKGKELIQNYGCFGCHDVKGMEEMKQIGPFLRRGEVTYLRVGEIDEKVGSELSSIGSKPIDRFDFGKLEKEVSHDRMSYIKQKMKAPRSFRSSLKMPDFHLSEEEYEAMTVLLLGFTDIDVPTRFKVPKKSNDYQPTGDFAKINDDLKCLNCHTIRGKGLNFAPDLSIEGSKVQESWLRQFLKQPDIIRPMLRQMPRFNLDHAQRMIRGNLTFVEIETIIQYFKYVLVSNDIPDQLPESDLSFSDQIAAGKKLYEEKGCRACHQMGEEGGALGPNLSNVGNRLTEGYIFKHLENPQTFRPDIVEPNYGFTQQEIISLTRYLASLKKEDKSLKEK
jgi:mono/diheme cytochrome c family protein